MLDVSLLFHEVEDSLRSNATRHDLQEMLLIALCRHCPVARDAWIWSALAGRKKDFCVSFCGLNTAFQVTMPFRTCSGPWTLPVCMACCSAVISSEQMSGYWQPCSGDG